MKTKIFFVTTNHNKYLEACSIFRNSDFLIIHKEDKYHEIQSNDLEPIVQYGLKTLSSKSIYPIMIEDSGLFIKNLNGFPGPYSSYIFNTLGNSGLLKLMKKIDDRQAVFKSVLGYSTSSSSIKIFEGCVSGKITTRQVGKSGFGFDPIFIPDGYTETFSQMNVETKNSLSHRGKSMYLLKNCLEI